MKRGRAAALARRRALAIVMTLAVVSAAVAPVAPGPAGTARAQSGSGTIVHSEDGVLLRAEPSFGAEVLETIPEGTTVGLRTNAYDTVYDADGVTQWWPIANGSAEGWVAGFYLEIGTYPQIADEAAVEHSAEDIHVADPSIGGEGDSTPAEEHFLATWDLANAAAVVAEPEGVNLRQDPGSGSPAVRALSYQTVVELRVDEVDTVYSEGSRWWPVRVDGLIGWVSGTYLEPTEVWADPAESGGLAEEITSKVADFFAAGSYVAASTDDGVGVNIRADAAPDAERIGIVPESDVVQVMEGPQYDPIGNPWYMITDGEVTGFVSGWYLARADQPGQDLAAVPEIPSKVTVPGVATGSLQYPLESWVFTQGFGCSPYWFEPWDSSVGCNYHNAVDLAAPSYTPLLAADGGIVEYAGWCDCGLGYYVKIDHGNGIKTIYGHMAEVPWVTYGEAVSKGDIIGPVGSTGMSTGPHVHFTVEVNGIDQDPLAYLP